MTTVNEEPWTEVKSKRKPVSSPASTQSSGSLSKGTPSPLLFKNVIVDEVGAKGVMLLNILRVVERRGSGMARGPSPLLNVVCGMISSRLQNTVRDAAWAISGDFNSCLSTNENREVIMVGHQEWLNLRMVLSLGLEILESHQVRKCPIARKSDTARAVIFRKLDRVLINSSWIGFFRGLLPDFCLEVFQITALLLRLWDWIIKSALKKLNSEVGDIHLRVNETRTALSDFQNHMSYTESEIIEEQSLISRFSEALSIEEKFLKQKSRIHWLKNGDSNNRHEDMADIATSYFKSLLGNVTEVGNFPDSLTLPLISDLKAERLCAAFSAQDVLTTLKSMAKNRCPGPDGFSVEFFLGSWPIVGEEVTKGILYFFQTLSLPRIVNSAAICLVPKIENPTEMHHFRPISCCNVLYKCISKMLASRLKGVMPTLISHFQSAFVPSRSIGDNVMLAQALCKNYHLRSGQPRCAVNWIFIKLLTH
ncbi:uncharacterized protein LOC141704334 [Apium graveolens]|uniref:uncharacterized protein LOC141704334 n=1 Tax=Apium graveolens TaxID=4045 RepID=UPI003D793D81